MLGFAFGSVLPCTGFSSKVRLMQQSNLPYSPSLIPMIRICNPHQSVFVPHWNHEARVDVNMFTGGFLAEQMMHYNRRFPGNSLYSEPPLAKSGSY